MSTVVAKHSRLGASSAERWMNCPGSNVIIEALGIDKETDESSFAAEGTAAHEAAAHCLREQCDAWEIMGQEFYKHIVDEEMADAVQFYLDVINRIRSEHDARGGQRLTLVEQRISDDFDDLFFGTVDDGEVSPGLIDVIDFKYGKGIAVDAEQNAQLSYYAVGIILKLLESIPDPENWTVRLNIIQPRAFHVDGPWRQWETTAQALLDWKDKELVPAMQAARYDTKLQPGEHCRFCPSKLACPLLKGMFEAAVLADASNAKVLSSEQLALEYSQIEAVKHYIRGLEREALVRLQRGDTVSAGAKENTFKLVYKKANRVLKSEGEKAIKDGTDLPFEREDAYETKLKSVAGLEAIGPKAKAWVKEFAFTPQKELTVAPSTDKRLAVKASKPEDNFGDMV